VQLSDQAKAIGVGVSHRAAAQAATPEWQCTTSGWNFETSLESSCTLFQKTAESRSKKSIR
jgi:hypothetical protein